MNVLPADHPINPRAWEQPAMRRALAQRDIGEVFRLLGAAGVPQRQIAALTGQNQSEISDIVAGRQVQAYDVLARIADGLAIPRGHLGLAYTDSVTQRLAASPLAPKDGHMERRAFLGLVSKIVMGAALTPAEVDLLAVDPAYTDPPRRVGLTDVDRLQSLTGALRSYDAEHGGGSCREAIVAHTRWAESLLGAACADEVRPRLFAAVAEIKTLAGWTAHDLGLATEARQYLTQAVRDTQDAGDPGHSAIVLYHLGRVPLDNGDPAEALKWFQLGQIAAQDSHSSSAVALLLTHEALAYAHLADGRQALTALRRAEDEYAHAEHDHSPAFLAFFDQGALQTSAARIHSRLGLASSHHRGEAIARLHQALEEAPVDRARQRAFNLAWLATCLLAEGCLAGGTEAGQQALAAASGLNSPRLLDHFAPLQTEAAQHRRDADVDQLAHAIRELRMAA